MAGKAVLIAYQQSAMIAARGRRRSPRLPKAHEPKHRFLCMEGAMDSANYLISPDELWKLIGTAHAPQVVDTRRREIYDSAPGLIPGAVWRDIAEIEQWSA